MTFKLTPEKPPYYKLTTNQGAPSTIVHSQAVPIETINTTPVIAAIYQMPGNTMSQPGDILEMTYWGNRFNGTGSSQIALTIFGETLTGEAFTPNVAWRMEATVIRANTAGTAYYTYLFIVQGVGITTVQGSKGSIDFTIPQDFNITMEAFTDGNLRCGAGYTQLLKIPNT